VLGLRGPDAECLEPHQLDAMTAHLATSLRVFGDQFVVNQYWVKRSNPPFESGVCENSFVNAALRNRREYLRSKGSRLFSYESYLVITRKADWRTPRLGERFASFVKSPKTAVRRALMTDQRVVTLNGTLDVAVAALHRGVTSFISQVKDDLSIEVLDRAQSFLFLRRLLNPDRAKAEAIRLKHAVHVDFFAADSDLECHRNHLRLGNAFVKVLTLKEPPAHTFAHVLRNLSSVQADIIVVTEWNAWDPARAVSAVRSKRRHFHNTKLGLWSQVGSERPYERELLFDDSKEALVGDLGRCLEDMEVKGTQIGEFSLTVVLLADSLEAAARASAEVVRVFGAHEAVLNEETYNGLNAFLAILPGGYPFNLRKLLVTDQNHADIALWFLPSQGERQNAYLGQPYLAEFETGDQSLYYFNLHVQDVGHTLVLGPTGTGKSFLLNFLITHAQKYHPYTFILDVGGSYRWLTEGFQGSYVSFRPEARPFSINLFALEPTPANVEFQFAFAKVLIESGGHRMSDAEDKELYAAIPALYLLDPEQRRLSTLMTTVPRPIGSHLRRWTEDGQYGAWFDNVADTVSYARFQCIDFEEMERFGAVLEPLLFYLLHRATEMIHDPVLATVFKLAVVDEAWLFFRHPVTRTYINAALRTWRKKNAAMILSTQSLHDLPGAEILRPVVESCPTKICLANPTLDAAFYGEVLQLTPAEQERVRRLASKRQFLLIENVQDQQALVTTTDRVRVEEGYLEFLEKRLGLT